MPIGPFKWLGHRLIKIVDEGQDLGFQILNGSAAGPSDQFTNQNAEPHLDLIHPRGMLGRIMKNDLVSRVGKKRRPRHHRLKNAALALFAQVVLNAIMCCHKPH